MFFKLIPISIWKNKKVKQRLSWYYDVMRDKKPAKYLVCKSIHTEMDIKNSETSELWKEHEQLSKIVRNKNEKIKLSDQLENLELCKNNFLDLKSEIANRSLDSCNLCE